MSRPSTPDIRRAGVDLGMKRDKIGKVFARISAHLMGASPREYFERLDKKKDGTLGGAEGFAKLVRGPLRFAPADLSDGEVARLAQLIALTDPAGALSVAALAQAVEAGPAGFVRAVHRHLLTAAANVVVYDPFAEFAPLRAAADADCERLEHTLGVTAPRPHHDQVNSTATHAPMGTG